MRAPGYEFLFNTPRWTLGLGLVGACLTLAVGALLIAAVFADHYRFDVVRLRYDEQLLVVGLAEVLVVVSGIVLRRTLMQAFDCRIGEAGIYFRSFLRTEAFIPWASFTGFDAAGPVARLIYAGAGGRRRAVWLAIPGGRATERLRLRTFLEGKLRARAAAAYAAAPPGRAPEIAPLAA